MEGDRGDDRGGVAQFFGEEDVREDFLQRRREIVDE